VSQRLTDPKRDWSFCVIDSVSNTHVHLRVLASRASMERSATSTSLDRHLGDNCTSVDSADMSDEVSSTVQKLPGISHISSPVSYNLGQTDLAPIGVSAAQGAGSLNVVKYEDLGIRTSGLASYDWAICAPPQCFLPLKHHTVDSLPQSVLMEFFVGVRHTVASWSYAAPVETDKSILEAVRAHWQGVPLQSMPECSMLLFEVGDFLEAIDIRYPQVSCVAHVKAVLENDSLLITFDGWSSKYDFVCPMDSTDIAPCGTTAARGKVLQGPKRRDISHSFKEDAQSWFDWREWLGEDWMNKVASMDSFRGTEPSDFFQGRTLTYDRLAGADTTVWDLMNTRASISSVKSVFAAIPRSIGGS